MNRRSMYNTLFDGDSGELGICPKFPRIPKLSSCNPHQPKIPK